MSFFDISSAFFCISNALFLDSSTIHFASVSAASIFSLTTSSELSRLSSFTLLSSIVFIIVFQRK
ncbi:hypothetical protein HOB94_04220 [bacterium]|nr:hypothetical protein [bacterium]